MAMKMFMNLKISVFKEFFEKVEQNGLMTDDLKELFEKEYEDIKEQSKQLTKSLNKYYKKKNLSSSDSESDENNSNKKDVKKEKRTPTEHQLRVSKCMAILKYRYPDVKHQVRLGTANYMATFIKNEFNDIDFDTEQDKIEEAVKYCTKQMNDKKGESIYCEESNEDDKSKAETSDTVKKTTKNSKKKQTKKTDEQED